MATNEVATRIEAFVRTQFSVSPSDNGFTRDADLFEGGYVDSVGVVELLEFLREEFAVDVPDDALLSHEFSTITGIGAIVSRLAGSQ
jgi:acyl carrier protein